MPNPIPSMIQVGDVIVSIDCLTEPFACDLAACKGQCCIDGDAGAPVTIEEIGELENALPEVAAALAPRARRVIERQGVAYTDQDGDLVTSIVDGKDCVFTCRDSKGCCLCAVERAHRAGLVDFCKPISCALYPIRVHRFNNGGAALNYHRWSICKPAREKGKREGIKVWQYLREPLTRAFGREWYEELANTVKQLAKAGYIEGE